MCVCLCSCIQCCIHAYTFRCVYVCVLYVYSDVCIHAWVCIQCCPRDGTPPPGDDIFSRNLVKKHNLLRHRQDTETNTNANQRYSHKDIMNARTRSRNQIQKTRRHNRVDTRTIQRSPVRRPENDRLSTHLWAAVISLNHFMGPVDDYVTAN